MFPSRRRLNCVSTLPPTPFGIVAALMAAMEPVKEYVELLFTNTLEAPVFALGTRLSVPPLSEAAPWFCTAVQSVLLIDVPANESFRLPTAAACARPGIASVATRSAGAILETSSLSM